MLSDIWRSSYQKKIPNEIDEYLLAPSPPYEAGGPAIQVKSFKRGSRWILFSQSLIIIILAASLVKHYHDHGKQGNVEKCGQKEGNLQIYSPVRHLLSYENVTWSQGFTRHVSFYQGPPTPEREAAWEDLYNFGLSKIPKSSAALLVSKTLPLPGDPDNYIIELQVFHSLHCLNALRRHYWESTKANFVPNNDPGMIEHMDHCIDDLRQYIMCSVDVTPLPWKWHEEAKRALAFAEVSHTCQNFGTIRKWGLENRLEHFDAFEYVEDDFKDIVAG